MWYLLCTFYIFNGASVCNKLNAFLILRVIQNIIDHKPKEHFFFAVDDSNNTLEEIIKVRHFKNPQEVMKVNMCCSIGIGEWHVSN